MSRYNLSYRYSLDYGTTWIDLSDIVDSAQTSIVHNLCSAGFKSQKDTASFTIPAVQSAVKQNLINALIDSSTILVEIKEDTNVIFTGYVDKDSISIRSYPLTSTLTIELTDVSTKALDDKVEEHIYLKEKTVTQIVHYLLNKAGYSYDSSIILPSDEITLEAFVIDKDDSDTYREYIDTLLFEVGGYVLDFNEKGIARIVKIDWKASGTASVVDNPMTSNGVTTKTNILKEDGVSLKWASTKWSADKNRLLWQDSISRKLEDNYIVGEDVENGAYWPEDGELSPVYQEYNADLLDTDYLTNATRKQNEDLSIIVAEDIRAEIQATKNNEAFTAWQYPIIQDFVDDYGLTENPIAYPKKAWYLLRNNSGETVNIQHFRLYGKVFYRDKLQTLKTKNTKNPKEYESKYIYSETHANQFLQFYWHFLQTSRTSVSWKEVSSEHTLGDVVQVYHKGSLSYVKAVIAGITTTFIGRTKITSYSAVGVAAQIVPFPTISLIATKGSDSSRSILGVVDVYATSQTQAGTKTDWQKTIPSLSAKNKFLWQKETIHYTDSTKSEVIALIGTYGDKGDTGAQGPQGEKGDSITIVDKSVQYASSTSGTATPSSWDNEPSPVKGQYLWAKTYVKYSDGTENTSYAVAYIGTDGQDGASASLEYSYSPSPDWCYTEDLYWQDDEIFWGTDKALWNNWASSELTEKDGQYIWMRSRVGDGSWQYTRLTGVQAKLFQLSATATTLTRNDRLSGTGQVTFFATIQGYYDATPALYIGDTKCTLEYSVEKQKYYYIYSYNVKGASKVTAYLYNGDTLMDSLVLDVVDYTEQAFYVGVVDTLPTEIEDGVSLLSGDTVFCSADNIVYVYGTHDNTLGWHKTNDYTVAELGYDKQAKALSWAMSDALSTIDAGSVSQSDYAYFNNLIVGLITAKYISSMQIQLQSSGVISSSEISTDTSEDINSQGFLTKKGFRLEDSGAIRANEFYFGTDKDGNRIVFDTTSLRCLDANGKILWELKPDGTATFSSKVSASDLTAQGEISATSLACNAITTQESVQGASCTNPTFTKELYSTETAYNLINTKYSDNTIRSQSWTYNSKTINFIALGVCNQTQSISGEGTWGRALNLCANYSNSKSISAGDDKWIINKCINTFSYPIWVRATISLGGNMNGIYSRFYFEDGSSYDHNEDANAWVCLMPNQGIGVHAKSWAWWGSQTAYANFYSRPTFNNFCFIQDPIEVTSLRNTSYTGGYKQFLFDIPLATGHPSTIVVFLNGNTTGSANLASGNKGTIYWDAYNGDTYLTSCTDTFVADTEYVWIHTISKIPSEANKLRVSETLHHSEKVAQRDEEGNITWYTTEQVDDTININRLTYAICYNYEAHNALIRYDDGSLQYLGTAQDYVKGNFSAVENTRYTSSSVFTLIKNSFTVSGESYELTNGEYNITSDSSITLDSTTYTNMSKMIVTDEYISFYGGTTSCIIYSSGYNTTGQGQAQQGGFLGDSYSSVSANITLLSQQLGAYTASLFAKENNTFDIGSSDMRYRQAYINTVVGNVNSEGDTEHKVYGAVFN